jgi:hypothetical protein
MVGNLRSHQPQRGPAGFLPSASCGVARAARQFLALVKAAAPYSQVHGPEKADTPVVSRRVLEMHACMSACVHVHV